MSTHVRVCVSCARELPRPEFRGNRFKAQACKDCEQSRPEQRWCIDCAAWLPVDEFYRVGTIQKFQTTRCKPCRVLFSHGVNKWFMAELTGAAVPACGACGANERLSVDHDHQHCAGEHGCRLCVRGYLCRSCNVSEGLLRTPERARLLADYMESNRLSEQDLAAMPASTRPGPRPIKPCAGTPKKYYVPREVRTSG